jgi:hypothetical protein
MRNIRRAVAVIGATVLIFLAGASQSLAGQDKVTICHAAGLADEPANWVTITAAYPAIYGEAGHFYENGTPRAGHEEDYLGPCLTPSPSASPSDSPEPSSSPSPTPSPSPSASPSESPSPTTTPPTPSPSLTPTPTPSDSPDAPLPTPPPTDTEAQAPASDEDGTGLVFWLFLIGTAAFILAAAQPHGRRRGE